jgi:hypothetical protein
VNEISQVSLRKGWIAKDDDGDVYWYRIRPVYNDWRLGWVCGKGCDDHALISECIKDPFGKKPGGPGAIVKVI